MDENDIDGVKRIVEKQINKFYYMDFNITQYEQILFMINECIEQKRSGSVMVTGCRGVGKSSLIKHVINNLNEARGGSLINMWLKGLYTSEYHVAIKEITRQLERCGHVFPKIAKKFTRISDYILYILKEGWTEDKNSSPNTSVGSKEGVIIVLDDMEYFIKHPKQLLLYDLFDMLQNEEKMPIFIICTSTRWDIQSLLEIRIKSRLVASKISLRPFINSHMCIDFMNRMLSIRGIDKTSNKGIKVWNDSLGLFLQENVGLFQTLQEVYGTPRILKEITLQSLYKVISLKDFTIAYPQTIWGSAIKMLPTLEIIILATTCMFIEENENYFNFEQIYHQHEINIYDNKQNEICKPLALNAYTNLINMQIFIFNGQTSLDSVIYRKAHLGVPISIVKKTIKGLNNLTSKILLWVG